MHAHRHQLLNCTTFASSKLPDEDEQATQCLHLPQECLEAIVEQPLVELLHGGREELLLPAGCAGAALGVGNQMPMPPPP